MNKEKVNNFGILFRFITPILITIMLYMLTMMQTNISTLQSDIKEIKEHFVNHLKEHKQVEVLMEKRLTRIETLLNAMDKGR